MDLNPDRFLSTAGGIDAQSAPRPVFETWGEIQ